ncbi:MAG: hypothetical protein P8Z37_15240 [Acidobacteriota bacterium]
MRKSKELISTTISIPAALLFLLLSGCGTPSEQSVQQDETQIEETEAAEVAAASAPDRTESVEPVKKTAPPPPPARKAVFAAGTPITVVTSSALSTKTNQTGEVFNASLNQDLIDGNWVVAKKGASVTGMVSDSDPGGRVKGVASITLQLSKLALADGRDVSISTTAYTAEARSTKKKDAARVGIGAGVGAAIGAIAGGGKGAAIGAGVGGAAGTGATLATRGEPAAVPSETAITFELTAPLEIAEQK